MTDRLAAFLAIVTVLAILAVLRFRRDAKAWLPYFADEDWTWERDPYLDRAHRVTHNPPYGHLFCS